MEVGLVRMKVMCKQMKVMCKHMPTKSAKQIFIGSMCSVRAVTKYKEGGLQDGRMWGDDDVGAI